MRLGELLVRNGVITEEQRQQIVRRQRDDPTPFGALAERMFGVRPHAVEAAWAEQFAGLTTTVDPRLEPVDPAVLRLIDRRQAWQFRVLPLRDDGDDVVLCTTREHLVRALKFTGWRIARSCHFLLADPTALGEALMRYYRLDGMTAAMVAGSSRA
jgi:hypothetical protein